MRIVMFTNTFTPHVGGVARSVERFTRGYRQRGHRVLVVAPTFENQPPQEQDVVRIPALQHFNGSDFSVALPLSLELTSALDEFRPDVIHSHHPFLLGDTAARTAATRELPLLFTFHTQYEYYTHYTPLEATTMGEYVKDLATRYANLCDGVIAPSESLEEILRGRGVQAPIHVVPTGVDLEEFSGGDGGAFRRREGIGADEIVIGHVGRLAHEKNLGFLCEAVAVALRDLPEARFVVVGSGPHQGAMEQCFERLGVEGRASFLGVRKGRDLVDAYTGMDVFAFASKSETQGMVLVEALTAGCPVVALDAAGAREVVCDGENGRLVREEDPRVFADALCEVAKRARRDGEAMRSAARASARPFDIERCVERALDVYRKTVVREPRPIAGTDEWAHLRRTLQREWEIWSNRLASAADAVAAGVQHQIEKEFE